MLRSVQLPTAPQPGWELENPPDDGDTELKSIPERYDVRIGPHVFSGTALYEVHYLPQAPTMVPPYPQQSHAPTTQTGPYTGQPSSMQQASTTQLEMLALSGQSTGTNGQIAIDSLFGSVTPEMSNQINMASISNPTLKNLLNLAATGQAPSDQLKTLELLIQSMRASQPPEPLTGSSSGVNPSLPPAAPPSAVKDFDLVIEFAEKQSDRWIIPRGPVRCERTHTDHKGNKLYIPDALLTMTMPVSQHIMTSTEPTKESAPIEGGLPQSPSQLVTMRISRPSSALLDAIFRWAGGEAGMEANKVALEELAKEASPRTFLQYHLPDGPLLQEIQSAVAPSYTTRSIAPSNTDSTRARRRQSRKVTIPSTQATPGPSAPPAKRKKQQQLKTKQPAPFSISCQACGQTDVPLMMGGRR
ncbi:hypothetical protein WOLCODRAFT_87181 [Wolfiporia cocos MD-104 SS10]|uniref:Uncharacterized protein n=1 Tax=Wolfiporia cocos (strain MD-104) TaxID=742152 RepID=A0A2H3J2K3_WOLCO|nr:hypothetical protein WOLCODRAFT_87181 [Wolfiporia cocos MD-104 SS10]